MPSDALSGLGGILNSFSNSSLCQNGKQVEIITKMIFELCYIEAIKQYFYLPFLACTDKTIIFVVVKFNIIIYKKR